ncbi:MAG TPA: Gfo/Idh/MocA family oxidoreductase [Armatimonadota bacterium]|nr:Gfo/Idh/MocA family oxidoreductase [Armatimonadota bacterium]
MIKLGIVGMSDGNGHPYSWAAIINGYDREAMASCPFPVIPQYLGERSEEHFGIGDARVTHIWTQERKVSEHIAKASKIEFIADRLEDMVPEIDALLLARDDGENHLKMAAPFLDKGIPVFIDKPLADNRPDLDAFLERFRKGQPFLSSSCFRYCKELKALKDEGFFYATAFSPKYWRTYGIHLLEGLRTVMGGGFKAVRDVGTKGRSLVQLVWDDGREALLEVVEGVAGPIAFQFHKADKWVRVDSFDTFSMFKAQLADFIGFVDTGNPPFSMEETFELVSVVVGARESRDRGGDWVELGG